MDIPNTGAIFTLGKSHLAENTQSYFYIKNDPVKRLISGPCQSAVICESGRLFVWGENHHGQLGIGGSSTKQNNNNNNNGNGGKISDVVTKPTCVKSLKLLGLKIADVAYGNDWAVMLTHSNELFYTGRNIFHTDTNVAKNFIEAELATGEKCALIRKPFRLEEFDDCLTNSEEEENFVTVLAGNEHFAVMTSTGRLIGWGSNDSYQLGLNRADYTGAAPFEIKLDAPIQQFTCGPESTLVLTEHGTLYLTGRLNEFVFPQFTELQKNLSANEQIIFMHISQTSEIYIVTNAGSIYRSYEAVRNKSLIFQRFYDYDSEENGPIWKLLKCYSFYAVLTKANKFYTTFSESGHHLKTFREISKFRNLRLLDMAVGEQHILVHGIPRSSTLSATVGANGEHRFMSRSFVLPTNRQQFREEAMEMKGGAEIDEHEKAELKEVEEAHERLETPKPNTPAHVTTQKQEEVDEQKEELDLDENMNIAQLNDELLDADDAQCIEEEKAALKFLETAEDIAHNEAKIDAEKSPTASSKSRSSANSIRLNAASVVAAQAAVVDAAIVAAQADLVATDEADVLKHCSSSDKLLRPRTPFPADSSQGSTPQTAKKTMRNFSYEAAMEQDAIENTTPLSDSFHEGDEDVEHVFNANIQAPTPLTHEDDDEEEEEDEQLTVEIQSTVDELDQTTVINEIRFINNGIDVTQKVAASKALQRIDSVDEIELEENESETEKATSAHLLTQVKVVRKNVEQQMEQQVAKAEEFKDEIADEIKTNVAEIKDEVKAKASDIEDEVNAKAAETAEKVETKYEQAMGTMENAAHRVSTGARGAVDAAGANAKKMATGARDAVDAMGANAMRAAAGAGHTVGVKAKEAATDAADAIGAMGNKAKEAANDAKHAMGNVFTKAANNTRNAMDSMTHKVSDEMQETKENLSAFLHKKSATSSEAHEDTDEAASTSDATSKDGQKTIIGEDDERTTASVNSNHTSSGGGRRGTVESSGNPFENDRGNPFESEGHTFKAGNPFENELDSAAPAYSSGKQVLREQLTQAEEQKHRGKVRQFFSDMKTKGKGISCRSEKAIRIDDEPPRYTPVDQMPPTPPELQAHSGANQVNGNNNTSKVCSIL